MAKNDMEVIEYKILAYLYESLKAGHTTTLEEVAWKCRLFDITREYWLVIMKDLIDNGYVSGLKYVEAKDWNACSKSAHLLSQAQEGNISGRTVRCKKSVKRLEKPLKSFSAVWSVCCNHTIIRFKHHAKARCFSYALL